MDKMKGQIQGTVVSDSMDKGIVVTISYTIKHPRFKKFIKRSKRVMVHDPENKAKKGNIVVLNPTRPVSKKKRYLLVDVVEA